MTSKENATRRGKQGEREREHPEKVTAGEKKRAPPLKRKKTWQQGRGTRLSKRKKGKDFN